MGWGPQPSSGVSSAFGPNTALLQYCPAAAPPPLPLPLASRARPRRVRGAQGRRPAGNSSGGADAQRFRGGTWPRSGPRSSGRSREAAAGGGQQGGRRFWERRLARSDPRRISRGAAPPSLAGDPRPPALLAGSLRLLSANNGKKAPFPSRARSCRGIAGRGRGEEKGVESAGPAVTRGAAAPPICGR